MKVEWNKRYTTIAIYSFVVIACSILLYMIMSNIDEFSSKVDGMIVTLRPFIIGGAIAYLLNFMLKFYENLLSKWDKFNKQSKKVKRSVGLILTYLSAMIMVYLFLQFVLPQLVDSILGLANSIPQYVKDLSNFTNDLLSKVDLEPQFIELLMKQWNDLINAIIAFITNMVPVIGNMLLGLSSSLFSIFIGVIVSIYMLIDKEKLLALSRKIIFAFSPNERAKFILRIARISNDTFGKFLVGKIIDSLIIGVLTFCILSICKMPYTLLISVIIGITNIIPFFGPFFGAIPSVIIVLFVSPTKALWLILIVFIIQQIDGNIIGPKILGDSIGISAFWILFSLLIFSKLLGFVGMIVGVPIFAVVYSLIKETVELRLKSKGLPTSTDEYK
ncbi:MULTISPECIES: AI-2E family transporter [Clostridium]|uniref:Permease n=1 Tax=Clostridium disporicum TaxID=84024 RepID=A0A174DAE4_9CLOT|nr:MULTISPECIES: AI-2E family transporter [Clostridium]MCD2500633.1 AI-2E family transporter [Clostridium sp. NSJ-145]MDU6340106.1 AI-2E family transporter [Clostridium sp.]CUO21008.1 permease [Clostridium disporicum]